MFNNEYMKFFSFFFFLVFIGIQASLGQSSYDDQHSIALPSSTNDILKFQDAGVSLYTGAPQVNIPIWTVPSRELSLPLSLSYVGAGGIRVQDLASPEGLGWMFNAGGSISRVMR